MAEALRQAQPLPGLHASLGQIAEWLGCRCGEPGRMVQGVGTDSRRDMPGALFVALHGVNFDGHAFVGDAVKRGAVALLVERPLNSGVPELVVDDTRLALGRLATNWRQALALPLVAVTGSNGKTTVKEMAAAILACSGTVHATRGNLNNDIGVPLTLLELAPEHCFGVIEMGANHPGEIRYLSAITKPQVALITNAAPAHLAGFGTMEGVARAKGEIYEGLGGVGTALVNVDDAHAGLWRELAAPNRIVTFGLDNPADWSAEWRGDAESSDIRMRHPGGELSIRLALPGRHNVMNALAAAAVAVTLGAAPEAVKAGLEGMKPVAGRLQRFKGYRGATLIDDSYNANPASLRAGLEVLAALPGRRILALGDMGELGDEAEALHQRMGIEARSMGIDGLYAVGECSRAAVEGFGEGAVHFDDVERLAETLEAELGEDVTILIKGSRSMRMERLVAALQVTEAQE